MTWTVWLPLGVGTAIGTSRSIAFGTFADPLFAVPLLLVVLMLAGLCILRTIVLLDKLVAQASSPRATSTPFASLAAWLIAVFMIFGNGGDDVHLGLAYPSYLLSG